ncbi:MAG: DUF4139 domain-containing protein [Ardenticatenaceae bacterium]|nr:DUF4139 domain-containing protein [Ardenticatenaceae bacterium]
MVKQHPQRQGHRTKITLNQFSFHPNWITWPSPTHRCSLPTAKLINSGPSPLLAGSVNLFVGDEFIGAKLSTPANGEIELLLGVEERITVEREMIKRDVDKRLLRDNRQLRYGYEIKIKNPGFSMAGQIELQDQIPVSRHEQIKIKLERCKPRTGVKIRTEHPGVANVGAAAGRTGNWL